MEGNENIAWLPLGSHTDTKLLMITWPFMSLIRVLWITIHTILPILYNEFILIKHAWKILKLNLADHINYPQNACGIPYMYNTNRFSHRNKFHTIHILKPEIWLTLICALASMKNYKLTNVSPNKIAKSINHAFHCFVDREIQILFHTQI